jgi:hypothetical protein
LYFEEKDRDENMFFDEKELFSDKFRGCKWEANNDGECVEYKCEDYSKLGSEEKYKNNEKNLKNGCVWVKGVNEQNIVIKICM